jgi:hypothetical protein
VGKHCDIKMTFMAWLQGGPFLEVSCILTLEKDRKSLVGDILTKLKSFSPAVEFAEEESLVSEKIIAFNNGYAYDSKNPDVFIHEARIPVTIDTDGKRKAILSLSQLSETLMEMDFWFFGSVWDVPGWNQRGIKENELPIFHNLLDTLFDTFGFAIGTVGYEVSVINLFDTGEAYPNEKYNLNNLARQLMQTDHYFSYIIANKQKVDLQDIKGVRTTGNKQILEGQNYKT